VHNCGMVSHSPRRLGIVFCMANPEHSTKLRQGVEVWNRWRAKKINRSFRGDVSGEKFDDLHLATALLGGTDMRNCSLHSADLRDADLSLTKLNGADLRKATLCGANLRASDMRDVDLTGATVGWTVFGDLDLRFTKGLDKIFHAGPSVVGIETMYQSQAALPEVFLRGCGVPEPFIVQMDALIGAVSPIQFYSCFISYSTLDQDFADRVHADLQDRGVRCWFAPHNVHGGRKLHEQIDEAIRLYDRLLLILSEHSMSSQWVKTEIAHARQRERDKHSQVLFPITIAPFEKIREWKCFDADTGSDAAREIREYYIPDFSNWKEHDAYRKALERLVIDLKAKQSLP
jgi:hypothetical protein